MPYSLPSPALNQVIYQVSYRNFSWLALVENAWGKDWNEADPAYMFSNGREFTTRDTSGPYAP